MLSWPKLSADWVLEQSTNLGPLPTWIIVSPAFYQSGATKGYAPKPTGDPFAFFRLRQLAPSVATLSGYWPFEEGAASPSADFSRMGTPMEHYGVTMSAGRRGPGARFNGGSIMEGSRAWVSNAGYRVIPSSGAPFSVSLWFNIEASTAGRRTMVGAGSGASNGWQVLLDSSGPGPSSLVFAGASLETSLSITGKTLLLPGRWHQLTMTHDGHEASLYLDAARLASGPIDIGQTEGPIYFGGGVSSHDSFLGTLDEVRTFTHCLTEEEISVVGHWRFNDGAGGLALDSSIQGHHAGVTDTSIWTGGREGAAVDLGCGRIVIPNDEFALLPPSGGAFSLSMWLRPNALSAQPQKLMASGEATNGWELRVRTEAGADTWIDFCSTNHGGTLALAARLPLTNGAWTKLDVTYNGGVATLYGNGRELGSTNGAIRGTSAPLIVGAGPGAAPFDGILDELKVYSRERSAAEIGPIARTMWETVLLNTETNIVLQGFGPGNRPLTYNLVPGVAPTNGTVAQAPGSGLVTYRAGERKGPDAFAYTVSDGEFTSPPAIVTLSVVQPHWLSPNGGPLLPADGRDSAHAWAVSNAAVLDAIWRTNSYYDCFFYAPGVYETSGWKWLERTSAKPGCKHIGSGSSGPNQTSVKLVEALEDINEGTIFGSADSGSDGFEVHGMVLDCNATNLPRTVRGAPVWIRIPLATTGVVESVTLHWANRAVAGPVAWNLGRAAEFTVCARKFGTNTFCNTLLSTGNVHVVVINAEADELWVDLQRRTPGADFYGLVQLEVAGGTVSLPSARLPNGSPSQFDAKSAAVWIADGENGTVWTSGLESEVELAIPLARGTVLNHIELNWNCKTIPDVGRLGAAAEFRIRARDEPSGQLFDVPFARHGRSASGRETVTFGATGSTNSITTDEIVLVLTSRELGVAYYSLREVRLRNGPGAVAMRIPTARTTLAWRDHFSLMRAFDHDPLTEWASQGPGMTSAIVVHGNNMKFTELKVIGFGTHPGHECFPMAIGPPNIPGRQYPPLGNVLVEDCVFTQPAPKNKDGLTTVVVVAARPNIMTNTVVRRCSVIDVASAFVYSHAFTANEVEHSRVENCGVGVYFEPGAPPVDYGPINVRSNVFINVTYGVYLLFHPGAAFDVMTCQGNEIVLDGRPGWGIAACDTCSPGPSGTMQGLTILNNVIRAPDWGLQAPGSKGGIFYTDITHGVIGNNVVVLGITNALRVRHFPAGIIPPPTFVEDCDYLPPPPIGSVTYPASMDLLPPGYGRAWFNNRGLSGSLLDVQHSSYGADGKASQQQWPE